MHATGLGTWECSGQSDGQATGSSKWRAGGGGLLAKMSDDS